ncbi:rho GTPase-activating protein 44 isoform X1 [Oncorhynchus kisutch]|uniref:rho GTPase-activating protein 44 isoform X1 n=1 Tax=Oncorhynchus kisutch TaxID=8019 RepID=UPI0012DF4A93|nr:rho GTPase-activating protein 44-like isoform X1 [Oncorhynchus kisutch]
MKKQFNRMRQLANQTVGRAEKTEVLSDDLLQVEKRLDLVKQVTHSTHKKLTACLQGQQGAEEREKKSVKSPSKKLPLTILAQCMVEGAAVLGDDSLLGKMLNLCGETEEKLAQELIQFEFQIEKDVVEPLYELAEVDIPNIQKQRKHLAKLVLDMDSARTRFHQSSKSSSHPSNLQAGGAKGEALREEMEEAANRMEICRDQLSADMYNFVAKEIDYANYFQTLIEIQAEYHRKSLEILQSVLPTIKAHQEAWVEKPSYGKALEEHLTISSREIAFPIEACVTMLLECGMQEEGLFRVAPSASKLKKLKASLDCGVMDVQEYSADPHAIAGALKSYLRELPEPLMTSELYEDWIQASNIQDMDKRLQALLAACEKLPTDNLNNFRYLIKFLAKLGDYQDSNKMTPGNMAIVLGPNLLWTHSNESGNMTEMMTTVSLQIVGIIEPIIQHADWFFPGDIEFNLTGCYGSPVHTNHNSNYSSMPSPDMDQSERKLPHDHGRRPLSVATDNMMLEFYKKDGSIRKIQSMGVRVMDTSWVSRKGSSTLARKASSTPPSVQGPGSPADHSLILEQPGELAQSPSPPPQPGERDRIGSDDVSPNRPDSSHVYPPPGPGEERPPPPYPTSTLPHLAPHHFYPHPKVLPCPRPVAPGPESQPPGSPPLPLRWSGFTPPLPPPTSSSSSSSSSLDINSNPKPSCLHFPSKHALPHSHPLPGDMSLPPHAPLPPDMGKASPLYMKTPLVLARHDLSLGMSMGNPPSLLSSAPPLWATCPCARERGLPRLTSTLRSKESSPVIGHKGVQVAGPTVPPGVGQQSCSQSPHSTEHSPHTMRKVSKKPAPIPPKVPAGYGQSGGSGGISDQSTGQPSPVSLSPTPPSTPSPYGLAGPPQAPGGLGASSPGQTPLCGSLGSLGSLSSPPSLTGTLGKSRPTPKPRQRPSLPPPQPPTVPQPGATPVGPGPLEQGILDGLSPGESMSTDYFNYEIPSINVNLDSLIDEFSGAAPCRRYGAVTHSPPPRRDDNPDHDPYAEDDEPQDTTL